MQSLRSLSNHGNIPSGPGDLFWLKDFSFLNVSNLITCNSVPENVLLRSNDYTEFLHEHTYKLLHEKYVRDPYVGVAADQLWINKIRTNQIINKENISSFLFSYLPYDQATLFHVHNFSFDQLFLSICPTIWEFELLEGGVTAHHTSTVATSLKLLSVQISPLELYILQLPLLFDTVT